MSKKFKDDIPIVRDAEGTQINPYIPRFISHSPWYLDKDAQKTQPKTTDISKGWYARGTKVAVKPTKYRKGACENCGSITHKTKDCLERPRAKGAKFTGKDLKADDVIVDVALGYEGKRDRWNGYDPSEQLVQIEEWEKVDKEHRSIRAKKLEERLKNKKKEKQHKELDLQDPWVLAFDDMEESDDDVSDDERYAEMANMPGQKVDAVSRTTVRNLRIREDRAKYLMNLDEDSAYYDPKTRTMKENPLKNAKKKDLVGDAFMGDGYLKDSGDAATLLQVQKFAEKASEKGNLDVHLQSDPTRGELLYREYLKQKQETIRQQKETIIEKYGGEEHLMAPSKDLLLQSEDYIEYSETGSVVKGPVRMPIRSKYAEDVYPGNHSSVWGSYYANGKWGFQCCHSTVKQSYCTGESGKQAIQESIMKEIEQPKSLLDQYKESEGHKKPRTQIKLKDQDIHFDVQDLDQEKLKESIMNESLSENDPRKRKLDESSMSREELEAYRLTRIRRDDPMANYKH